MHDTLAHAKESKGFSLAATLSRALLVQTRCAMQPEYFNEARPPTQHGRYILETLTMLPCPAG